MSRTSGKWNFEKSKYKTMGLYATIFLLLNLVESQDSPNYTVCETSTCLHEGMKFQSNIRDSVEPCENFYDFACGGWMNLHPAPEHWSKISQVTVQEEQVAQNLIDILEAPSQESDSRSLKSAKNIYRLCIDKETRNSQGLSPIEHLTESYGGWPIVLEANTWNVNNDVKWQDVSEKIERYSKGGIYRIHTALYDRDVNIEQRAVLLKPSTLITGYKFLMNPERYANQLEKYKDYIRNITTRWTTGKPWSESEEFRTAVDRDIEDILNFAIEMAKTPGKLTRNETTYTIQKLQNYYDSNNNHTEDEKTKIDWLNVIRNAYWSVNVTIDSSEEIYISELTFFKNLSNLLHNASVRTIVNYIIWTVVIPILPHTIVEDKDLNGRRKSCARGVNLHTAIDYEFTKTYFPDSQKAAARVYVNDVIENIKNQFPRLSWMDDQTRAAALNKVNSMQILLGGPDWYSNEAVDDYYSFFFQLNQSSTYVGNIINIDMFIWRKHLKRLESRYHNTTTDDPWGISPTQVSALYFPSYNALILTAGILKDYFFNENRPAVLNYGLLGWAVSHEVLHGVDRDFTNYDGSSDRNAWSSESYKAYKNLSQCFIDQYDGYVIPQSRSFNRTINVNGNETLHENIADSGISIVYDTYKRRKEELNESDVRLPGLLTYNSDQLFFIAAASLHCENFLAKFTRVRLYEPHAIGRARVIGSFSNIKEFSDAFHCPTNSPMNSEGKCNIWKS